jgi:hypothetical protein
MIDFLLRAATLTVVLTGIFSQVFLQRSVKAESMASEPVIEQKSKQVQHTELKQELDTKEKASAKAKAMTGPGVWGSWRESAMVSGNAIDVPFLGTSITGSNVWRVDMEGASLHLKSARSDIKDNYARSVSVWLDPQNGRLLKIRCVAQTNDTGTQVRPSTVSAERQMRDSGEVYVDFPAESPAITFEDALDSILSGGIGSPLQAKEIDGVYVLRSAMEKEPQPVWAITLWGIPPLEAHGRGAKAVPVSQRNHIRNIVDARTGKVLNATTVPQVDEALQ